MDYIRIFIYPINEGWAWEDDGWNYDTERKDDLTDENKTKDMKLITLNSALESIELTVECESDFMNNMLPILNFQTRVRQDGQVEFKHFTKPMAVFSCDRSVCAMFVC